jgi:hypothetical protein
MPGPDPSPGGYNWFYDWRSWIAIAAIAVLAAATAYFWMN